MPKSVAPEEPVKKPRPVSMPANLKHLARLTKANTPVKAEPKPKKVEEEEPESGTSYCGVVIPPYRPAQINCAIRHIANGRMEEAALEMGFTVIELERWMARWPERWTQLARLRSPGQVNQFIAESQGKWE